MSEVQAQSMARACADAMWASDNASRALGMEILEIAPGRARISMAITDRMTNGYGMCHGGYIFTLADSAFAFACNTYNQVTVAQHCSVTFIRPGKLGDRLMATAEERTRAGRSGIYDVTVTGSDGRIVAEFRGHSRVIEGTLLGDGKTAAGTYSKP